MTPPEEWRRIAQFPDYEVSSLGRVRSWNPPSGSTAPYYMHPNYNTSGYLQVPLRLAGQPGTRKTMRVHELVAKAFLGERPGHPRLIHICHNDGNKDNNAASNLRYDTVRANVRDSYEHGSRVYVTHCKRGHEYTPENTAMNLNITSGKPPTRYCRTCKRELAANRYHGRSNAA